MTEPADLAACQAAVNAILADIPDLGWRRKPACRVYDVPADEYGPGGPTIEIRINERNAWFIDFDAWRAGDDILRDCIFDELDTFLAKLQRALDQEQKMFVMESE